MQLYYCRCHTNSQKTFSEITVTTREVRLQSARSVWNPYTTEGLQLNCLGLEPIAKIKPEFGGLFIRNKSISSLMF